ncbi:hypothetical protein EYC80_006217 [Monilinia laxa]|uniref:Uncharacterized protein n=1 Tax=Monilinia laxa TaxID=61186 RepID=A0A5N6KGJ1_MONLA|nr:hypothetical protein EYC80_006217 [Monilinia laxa]
MFSAFTIRSAPIRRRSNISNHVPSSLRALSISLFPPYKAQGSLRITTISPFPFSTTLPTILYYYKDRECRYYIDRIRELYASLIAEDSFASPNPFQTISDPLPPNHDNFNAIHLSPCYSGPFYNTHRAAKHQETFFDQGNSFM